MYVCAQSVHCVCIATAHSALANAGLAAGNAAVLLALLALLLLLLLVFAGIFAGQELVLAVDVAAVVGTER